ncbi:uncharacterized protein GBIM_12998 [Gryllus bimaculatus]|nr:uncharacterized protein GBIM_12998 [Gryllus bimaculatus]
MSARAIARSVGLQAHSFHPTAAAAATRIKGVVRHSPNPCNRREGLRIADKVKSGRLWKERRKTMGVDADTVQMLILSAAALLKKRCYLSARGSDCDSGGSSGVLVVTEMKEIVKLGGSDDLRAPEPSVRPRRGLFRPLLADFPELAHSWPLSKSIYDDPSLAADRITVPGYRYLPVSRETYGYSPRNLYPGLPYTAADRYRPGTYHSYHH